MYARKLFSFILAVILTVSTFGLAVADENVAACDGDQIIGRILSLDEETGMILVETESGHCVIYLDQEYDHPIVGLFDDYFGDDNQSSFTDALDALDGWATYDDTELIWQWSSEVGEGSVQSTVLGLVDNGNGTYTLELAVDGEVDTVFVVLTDPDEIAYYLALLDATTFDLSLIQDGEGNTFISSVGDDVMAYHDDGIGFGVLVKFYSLAADSDLSVEELVVMFKEEKVGLGLIFRKHGTPGMMGVGHIKQDQKENEQSFPDAEHGKKNKEDKQNKGGKPENKGNQGKNNK